MTVASYNGSYAMTPGGYFVHPPLPNSAMKWSAEQPAWFGTACHFPLSSDLDRYLAIKFSANFTRQKDYGSCTFSMGSATTDHFFGVLYPAWGSDRYQDESGGNVIRCFNNGIFLDGSGFNGAYKTKETPFDVWDVNLSSDVMNTYKYVVQVLPDTSSTGTFSAFVNGELKCTATMSGKNIKSNDAVYRFSRTSNNNVTANVSSVEIASFRHAVDAAAW